MRAKPSMMDRQSLIMLAIGFILIGLFVLPTSLQAASTTLVINEIMYDQTGTDATQEFVEIYVATGGSDLGGYTLTDQDGHTAIFPNFTPNSDEYIVIHSGSSTQDLTGPVYNLYFGDIGNNSGRIWNDPGDDVLLKDSGGTGIDYIAYGGGSGAEINDPPPELSWSGPNPSSGIEGTSISLIDNGVDGDSGVGWEESGTTTTYGPTTQGANNNESTAVTLSSFTAHPIASQPTFFHWQWAVGLVLGGVAVARRLLER
jgi:hypothetical protein